MSTRYFAVEYRENNREVGEAVLDTATAREE